MQLFTPANGVQCWPHPQHPALLLSKELQNVAAVVYMQLAMEPKCQQPQQSRETAQAPLPGPQVEVEALPGQAIQQEVGWDGSVKGEMGSYQMQQCENTMHDVEGKAARDWSSFTDLCNVPADYDPFAKHRLGCACKEKLGVDLDEDEDDTFFVIDQMSVASPLQGRGIGKALVQRALDYACDERELDYAYTWTTSDYGVESHLFWKHVTWRGQYFTVADKCEIVPGYYTIEFIMPLKKK